MSYLRRFWSRTCTGNDGRPQGPIHFKETNQGKGKLSSLQRVGTSLRSSDPSDSSVLLDSLDPLDSLDSSVPLDPSDSSVLLDSLDPLDSSVPLDPSDSS